MQTIIIVACVEAEQYAFKNVAVFLTTFIYQREVVVNVGDFGQEI